MKNKRKGQFLNNEFCEMYISTNKSVYCPGDVVSGNVFIMQKKEISASIIELTIRGKEKVSWEELLKGSQGNTNHKEKFQENKELFRITQALSEFKTKILKVGQYAFPFTFTFHDCFPGSFELNYGFYKAKIKYSLTCTLRSDSINQEPFEFVQSFIVRQNPKVSIINATQKASSDIKSCLFNKGISSISCKFEKDTYFPGDKAKLLIELDNQNCAVNIIHITITLVQIGRAHV